MIVLIIKPFSNPQVNSEKQQVRLSDSYLPVAMQVIAHLTDQMAYEVGDEPSPAIKPTTRPSTKPTVKPTMKPTYKPTTKAPYVTWSLYPGSFAQTPSRGWWMSYGAQR